MQNDYTSETERGKRGLWWSFSGSGLIRGGLIVLAAGQLVAGGWAVLSPRGFYANFPGWSIGWVQSDGPFNHHLVVDAGTGFVAIGVALFLAALSTSRELRLLALATYLTAGVPHLAYHVRHVPEVLGSIQGTLTWLPLALGSLLAVGMLIGDGRSRERVRDDGRRPSLSRPG